jgi:hypothetical protein
MDEFDFKEDLPTRKPRKFSAAVWNLGSLMTLLVTLVTALFGGYLFIDPQTPYNPLPPATQNAVIVATQTSILPTAQPSATFTETPSPTPEPTATPEPITQYSLQEGSPVALDASVFHPELACNFLGVAGQAFGADDAPIAGLRVRVLGTLNGQSVDKTGLTGAASAYGPGSYYEIQLADAPAASDNSLQVMLLNEAGQTISDGFTFSTTAECSQNLILINFKEIQ